MNTNPNNGNGKFPPFDRQFFDSVEDFTRIGKGSLGGKASGLAFIYDIIHNGFDHSRFPSVEINIPRLTVICSGHFDSFMQRNNLYEIAYSDMSDERKAREFQKASMPAEMIGDLRSITEQVQTPLSVRSSSMLEDDRDEPFAGIYATKMISNNQQSIDERFHKLIEAVKFVYASTYFKAARDYINATQHNVEDEKMSVIIQEVVGKRHEDRYYPTISGVARSFNYYPLGKAKPEDGVVNLALGLGKTIVDGGNVWMYSPNYPKAVPPYANTGDILKNTQLKFWAVNMGRVPVYDPINEIEYLTHNDLTIADEDDTLKYIASTFSAQAGRLVMGTGHDGARVLTFAPLLVLNEFNFNGLIKSILKTCEEAVGKPVEIEFACTVDNEKKKLRFGFLQVRPMYVSEEKIAITEKEIAGCGCVVKSDRVLGNGERSDIEDIVFVNPDIFEKAHTPKIANEIEQVNRNLLREQKPYLLIGFGRWGSSDPWLGIPVEWGQIAGAKTIVEATLPGIDVDLSQGSHFFHNLTSFQVNYFSVRHTDTEGINWDWLKRQKTISEYKFIKHVRTTEPLKIKVDGRTGRGVILQ